MTTTDGRRYVLRLTPNGAPPLAESLAALDRLLVVFTIPQDSTATPEHMAAWLIDALALTGRVHVMLEPLADVDADRERARAAGWDVTGWPAP
jgi:hypothetical protein